GLGASVADLGLLAAGRYDLPVVARPQMRWLLERHNETVFLGVLEGAVVVTLEVMESAQRIRVTLSSGEPDSAHTTSLGKAMLAFLPKAEQKAIFAALEYAPITPNAIRNERALRAALEVVRAQGFAVDDEETTLGARCVGAPIFGSAGRPVAALSI